MGYVSDDVISALRGSYNLGLVFRLGTNPPLRLWAGVNSSPPIGITAVDAVGGNTYIGAGGLLNIPDLEILINGLADRVDFSLSGLDAAITADLQDGAAPVLGAEVHVGFVPLDSNWQPTAPIVSLWVGTADFWAETQEPQTDITKSQTRTLTLSTSTGDTSRARPRLTTFTDSAQKLRFPTDRFFERVSRYIQSYSVTWPRF